jgi:hypothetical protein
MVVPGQVGLIMLVMVMDRFRGEVMNDSLHLNACLLPLSICSILTYNLDVLSFLVFFDCNGRGSYKLSSG